MPIEIRIDEELDITHAFCWGRITLDEMLLVQADYPKFRGYRKGRLMFVDARFVTDMNVDFKGMSQFLTLVRKQYRGGDRWPDTTVTAKAISLAPTALTYGMSRLFQSLALLRGGVELDIYRDPDIMQRERPSRAKALQALLEIEPPSTSIQSDREQVQRSKRKFPLHTLPRLFLRYVKT